MFLFVSFDVIDPGGGLDEEAALKEIRIDGVIGATRAAEYIWEICGRGAETKQNLDEDYHADCGEPREVVPVQAKSKVKFQLKINAELARMRRASKPVCSEDNCRSYKSAA